MNPIEIEVAGPFFQISVGHDHVCALDLDSQPHCWGADDFGQSRPPPVSIFRVSAGNGYTCGISNDNKALCWGRLAFNVTGVSQVSASRLRRSTLTCFLDMTDGGASCTSDGVVFSGIDGPFLDLAADIYHRACGVLSGGGTLCWYQSDQSDGASQRCHNHPSGSGFVEIAQGEMTCARRANGRVDCWTWSAGDCWPGHARDELYTHVSAGVIACGDALDGGVSCWNTAAGPSYRPVQGLLNKVSVGANRACALRPGGDAICWRLN
jgi:hypothetical protein